MTPRKRRIVQALLYEFFAVAFVAPVLSFLFGQSAWSTMVLTLTMSAIAMGWNFVFNGLFERWETRHPMAGRSWQRRVAHGVGFEVGLAFMLIPLMAWWLGIGLWEALVADIGIVLFFLVYTVVFTWCFDRVFGLPESAKGVKVAAVAPAGR
jgi:uncharacterized membrane protein